MKTENENKMEYWSIGVMGQEGKARYMLRIACRERERLTAAVACGMIVGQGGRKEAIVRLRSLRLAWRKGACESALDELALELQRVAKRNTDKSAFARVCPHFFEGAVKSSKHQ